jgi:hypothetical protein
MEIEFLSALDYNVFVSEQQYTTWMSECEKLISMDTRRKFKPSSLRSSVSRRSTGLVQSVSQPCLLPAATTTAISSLKRSASVIQPIPKRMCLPNTPPPDNMLHYNILPPLVRSRAPPQQPTSQYYSASRPQTPVYTPTLPSSACDPFATMPVPMIRYQRGLEDILANDKMMLPSWSSMPNFAVQPPPPPPPQIYYRPHPTSNFQGPLSLAL